MIKIFLRIMLSVQLSFFPLGLCGAQSSIKVDDKLVPILQEVLPINISEASNLTSQEKKDLECIAWNLYFEARGGSLKEKIAVAWVPINRTQYSHWSRDICEVIFQYDWANGKKAFQFSWAAFNLSRSFKIEPQAWQDVQLISYNVYKGFLNDPSNGATYFYHHSLGPINLKSAKRIGSHYFYHR